MNPPPPPTPCQLLNESRCLAGVPVDARAHAAYRAAAASHRCTMERCFSWRRKSCAASHHSGETRRLFPTLWVEDGGGDFPAPGTVNAAQEAARLAHCLRVTAADALVEEKAAASACLRIPQEHFCFHHSCFSPPLP